MPALLTKTRRVFLPNKIVPPTRRRHDFARQSEGRHNTLYFATQSVWQGKPLHPAARLRRCGQRGCAAPLKLPAPDTRASRFYPSSTKKTPYPLSRIWRFFVGSSVLGLYVFL